MKKKSDIRTSSINQMTGWLAKNIPDLMVKSDWTHQDFDIEGVVNGNGVKSFYMVEVKEGWVGTWPTEWTELRIPYKNKKVLDVWQQKYKNELLTFIIFSKDLKKAWHVPADIILHAEAKQIHDTNKLFFRIDVRDIYQTDMTYDNSSS